MACGAALFCSTAWEPSAQAQVFVPEKGHGSVSLDYQQVQVKRRTNADGVAENLGKVSYRTLRLDLDYGFADRWALNVGLPYGSNRGTATDHDPAIFQNPHGQHKIDTGTFHGGWKDWSVGVRYRLHDAPLLITPYVTYGFPSHAYQYYGESALGLHQWALHVGVDAGGRFPAPLQNLYATGGIDYAFTQKEADRRVNYSIVSLDVGYYFSPRFSARIGFSHRKTYNGLDFPEAVINPDGSLNEEVLFHHDTNRNISYNEAHLDLSYQLNDRYTLFADAGRFLNGKNANLIKSAIGIGISRSF